ncbi:MGMT family protein [Pseudofrankia inefficax]|uniref:Methylated-DNA-(Protein)-cysteine S-methyltransferase DNA binding protein n=1 Tax=Pseudofrankia inefficax (strain DSM 45817 / CECT 9037 / DDB 130130 / EuI1c) TaxID=298654 RepID=E3IWJ5_PSEI1|nr:MGMT family protein [Pseudofrankia inefficax]ADP80178.1 Methylated-DNA-(protein)-cysteine S-methyltransferase DNA binding protein [Pseudofrankia inefficax]
MTLLFKVNGAKATALPAVSLAEAGLSERADLQEWVLANPAILGDDVMVVTSEYDQWTGSDGLRARDRLDILGLSTAGRLVVVELKRDAAPGDTHLQAINYAAMVSGFTLDTLADAHATWLTRRGNPTDRDSARALLLEHLGGGELDPELLRKPRIMLIAGAFPRQVTNTAVWLSQFDLIVELVEVAAWRSDDGFLAGFNRLWPTTGAEEFTLSPMARADAERVSQKEVQRSRAASAVRRLIDAETLADGTTLRLTLSAVPAAQRAKLDQWIQQEPSRGRAAWQNDPKGPLRWEADGGIWTPTRLVLHILAQATGSAPESVRGPIWWEVEAGHSLADLAEAVPGQSRRDWSDLHACLDALPAGRWTTYGDLAQVVATKAQPLGQHIATCPSCQNRWRVLDADGTVAADFKWPDPSRADTPQQVLESEGITFTNGTADPSVRLSLTDVANLLRRAS